MDELNAILIDNAILVGGLGGAVLLAVTIVEAIGWIRRE